MKSISERLKFIRKHLEMTQVQMASDFGIKQGYYTNLEKGTNDIKTVYIHILYEKYKVSPTWLITGVEPIFLSDDSSGKTELDIDRLVKAIKGKNQVANVLETKMTPEQEASIIISYYKNEE